MRVTRNMMLSNMMMNISDIQKKLFKNQIQISESRRVLTPSDDPLSTGHILLNQVAIEKNGQYQVNVKRAVNWIESTESILGQMFNLMSDVDALSNRAATDTYGADERHAFAEELSQHLDDLLKFARTTYNGRYIFGGKETLTAPFEESSTVSGESFQARSDTAVNLNHVHIKEGSIVVKDEAGTTTYVEGTDYTVDYDDGTVTMLSTGNMVDGTTYQIDYETEGINSVTANTDGISGDIKYQIGNDVTMTINVSGEELFQSDVDYFQLLIDLRTAVERDDIETIQSLMGQIKDGMDHIARLNGEVGSRLNRLNMTGQFLENESIQLEQIQSRENDLDIAEAMVQMQALDLAYQTSLQANSEILRMNLVNLLNV